MRKTKTKRDEFWQPRTLAFSALWSSIYGAGWFGLYVMINLIVRITDWPDAATNIIPISFVVFCAVMAQVQLVERVLKRPMRGWIAYSLIGLLLTFLANNVRENLPETLAIPGDVGRMMIFLTVMLPLPLLQSVWLRSRVRSAWLWTLISVAAIWVVAVGIPQFQAQYRYENGNDLLLITALLYGLIQGGVMRYLWMRPKETEKAKVDFDVDEQSDLEHNRDRAARLQTADTPPVTWHSRDEAMQRRDNTSLS